MQCLANKQRDVAAAQVLMEAMGASTEERQALKAALQDAEAPVAIGAAMALARQGDTDAAIVSRLAAALGSVPDRVVVSIGSTGLTGSATGWQVLACDGVQEGLMRAKSLPPKDVIVVQDGAQGVTLDTMVFALKNDPRSANVPLVIVTKDVGGVTALYGAKAAKVVATCGFADVAGAPARAIRSRRTSWPVLARQPTLSLRCPRTWPAPRPPTSPARWRRPPIPISAWRWCISPAARRSRSAAVGRGPRAR